MEVEGQWKASSGFEKKHLVGTSLGGGGKDYFGRWRIFSDMNKMN